MRKRGYYVAAFLAGSLLVGAGCASHEEEARPAPVEMRIGIDLWPGYFPLLFAEVDPALREQGVLLEVVVPQDTNQMLAEFAAGGLDGVAVALGDLITLAQGESDARVVLVSDVSDGGDAILGTASFKGAEDLRGARIGTNLGGFGELFVREMVARHDVAISEVTLVNVEAADVPARLADGTITAGHTWEPYVSQATQSGAQVWFSSAETPGLIPDVLAVCGELWRDSPEAVEALVAAWFRGLDRWRADEEAGRRFLAERLGISPHDVDPRGIRLLDRADNLELMSADSPLSIRRSSRRYIGFFLEKGMLRVEPDPSVLIDPSYL